jgi:hypothetical protein
MCGRKCKWDVQGKTKYEQLKNNLLNVKYVWLWGLIIKHKQFNDYYPVSIWNILHVNLSAETGCPKQILYVFLTLSESESALE